MPLTGFKTQNHYIQPSFHQVAAAWLDILILSLQFSQVAGSNDFDRTGFKTGRRARVREILPCPTFLQGRRILFRP